MALEYYDDILAAKIKKWMPTNAQLRVLRPEETARLFELQASDKNDKPLQLPLIALSRNNDIDLIVNIKNPRSFAGLALQQDASKTLQFNVIPIKLQYQLDIYTKTRGQGDEYMRQYLFKLINNPVIKLVVPYNGVNFEQTANIRVLPTISDTSEIGQRLFPGQFTRWTIQIEVQDAFLYDFPYRRNWKLYVDENNLLPLDEYSIVEIADDFTTTDQAKVETEYVNLDWRKDKGTIETVSPNPD